MVRIGADEIRIPARRADSHKYNYGKVLLICGSVKYPGAAYFSASAAVNSGSGLVCLCTAREIYPQLSAKLNEPVFFGDDIDAVEDDFDACLIGCGITDRELAERAIKRFTCPKILDAGALFSPTLTRGCIITPHEGEFKRLFPEYDSTRRVECARAFAEKYDCTLVLKGHETLTVAKNSEVYVNTSGNPGMAKAGSGDVLAGIMVSLLGQGIEPLRAAYTSVWVHGAAGDECARRYGEYGMTPTDMLGQLKLTLKGVCERA